MSANGQFLLAGLKSANAVGVFSISAAGALSPVPGSPFAASGAAASVDVNCAGTFAFVSDAGSSSVDAYAMAANGSLTPVAGSPFPSGGTSTINALILTPNNHNLLTADVFNSEVSSLTVGPDGSLQPVAGSPFAADDWVGALATTRAGDFVYSSLFSNGEVDGWSIANDGSLAPVPGRPFRTGQSGIGVQALTVFPPPTCTLP